jgi:hypothetical protein
MKNLMISILFSLSALVTTQAAAHEGEGPHGGVVTDFGDKYHLEGVLKGDTAHFYLLDEDEKVATIKKHDGGSISIVAPGEGVKKTDISGSEPFSHLTAPVAGKGNITAKLTLKVGSKTYTGKFKFKK